MDFPESYETQIDKYNLLVGVMTAVSQGAAGRPSETNKHYWASILFTRLCGSSVSLLLLLPRSPRVKADFDNWDFSAVAALGRQILECYLTFFYLCIDATTEDEWNTRWNVFNLHDCTSRIKMFGCFGSKPEEVKEFIERADELKTRLKLNSYFLSLEERKQKEILKGSSAYLLTQDEIITKMGGDTMNFRGIYRFLSAHVHSLPLSFYRIGDQNRGRGLENQIEKNYICFTLEYLCEFLLRAVHEMIVLFPGSDNTLSKTGREFINKR